MVNISDCCQNCGKDGPQLRKCQHCKVVFYCSDICEKEDRIEHSRVCSVKNVAPDNAELDDKNLKFKETQIAVPGKYNDGDDNNKNNYEDKLPISSDDISDEEYYSYDGCDDDADEATGCIDLEDLLMWRLLNPFDPFNFITNPFLHFDHPLICPRCQDFKLQNVYCPKCRKVSYCSKWCLLVHYPIHRFWCQPIEKRQCARCKRSDVELRKCSACNKVEYCSLFCQRFDWHNHKTSCVFPETGDDGSFSTSSVKDQCARCKKADIVLKKCSGCNNVQYCSKICQTTDWEQHKTSCKTSKTKADKSSSGKSVKSQCARCKKSDAVLKKCSGCNLVEYCSRACQSADWTDHKTSCKRAVKSQCTRCKKSDAVLKKCSGCNLVEYCSRACQSVDWTDHKTSCKGAVKSQCARCKKSDVALKKCYGCNNVKYCSKVCQTADWELHKTLCKTAKTGNGESSSKILVKGQCARCKKSGVALKKCVACNNVEYCSKVCQTADWELHKTLCKTAKTEDGESSSKLSVKGQCGKCKRSNVKLTKCTGCNHIEYCSKVCEIDDWTDHRKSCQIPESKGECANCSTSMRKCSGCHMVEYCSKDCESAHWKYHKKSCKASKTDADDHSPSEKSVKSQCAMCKRTDVVSEKCSVCNKIEYCSKSCQIADWKHHNSCKPAKPKDDKSSSKDEKCDNCGKLDEHLIECVRCKKAKYCSKSCQEFARPLHKKLCNSSKKSNDSNQEFVDHLRRTIFMARWLFPSYKMLYSFIDAKKEDISERKRDFLLITYIEEPTEMFGIRMYSIVDSNGYAESLFFYFTVDPNPYFSWDQLKRDVVICLLNPRFSAEPEVLVIDSPEQLRILYDN